MQSHGIKGFTEASCKSGDWNFLTEYKSQALGTRQRANMEYKGGKIVPSEVSSNKDKG